MKLRFISITLASTFLLLACNAKTPAQEMQAEVAETVEVAFESNDSKANYLLGYRNILQLESQGVDIDVDAFIKGVKDATNGTDSLFGLEEETEIMTAFSQQIQTQAKAKFDAVVAENKTVSAAFLAENKAKEGVITTESGLQYKVITLGTGEKPTAKSTVQVNYEGKLINGTVFDSSFDRGQPIEFQLSQVIKGWTEGLQLMPEGSSYEFYIPSALAYGEQAPASIGPGQALIFKVDLLQANFKTPE